MPSVAGGKNHRAAPAVAIRTTASKVYASSAAKNSSSSASNPWGGSLPLRRTESQKLGALTGRSRAIARAALNVVGDDPDSAFKLLMSDLALTVVDGLPCEIEPLHPGASAWLDGSGEVRSIGAFTGCSLLRMEMGRKEPLQLFALEPVDVCLLTRGADPLEDGWVELEYTELPEVAGVEANLTMQTRTFDPGSVVVPLDATFLPPIVRVVGKRAVAPPRNSVMPRSLAAPRSAPAAGHWKVGVALPPVVGTSKEAGIIAHNEKEEPQDSSNTSGQRPNSDGETKTHCEPEVASGSNRYHSITSVGKGAFGTVFLAEDIVCGRRVAMKCICHNVNHRVAMREADLLSKIDHPCVVPLLDSFEDHGTDGKLATSLVMEYLPQNLHQKIAGKPLALGHVRCFSFQLLRALAHLDGMQVCHRDLKPDNVLISDRALKLADFGSAKLMGSGPSTNYICSRWWRAPELVLGTSEYGTSIDWWSCGCVVAEMMLGRPLFPGQSSLGQIYSIMQALGTPSPDDIQAMHPRRGLGRIAEQLMKLAKLERTARPWQKSLPAFAGVPDALQLPKQLLVYTPSARLHPAEALRSVFFATLPEDDEALGPLPKQLFNFTGTELSTLPATSQEELLCFASRYSERNIILLEACTPSAEVPSVVDLVSLSTDVVTEHLEADEADEAGEAGTQDSSGDTEQQRLLKRRRISENSEPPSICIRLDSEDLISNQDLGEPLSEVI